MKVVVTGAKGQLGQDVMAELAKRGHEGIGVDIQEMDITDAASVREVLTEAKPDAVVHCAAWTAVDIAEDEENRSKVHAVNALGTRNIAAVCRELDCKLLYISTDYVFSGEGTAMWEPDDTNREPVNWYGQTKYEGELAVEELLSKYFIVRIAWAFGEHGANFVRTMLRLGKQRDRLTVVKDQVGSPTYMPDVARLIVDMIETDRYGRYHATNEGFCSWYEFAKEIFRQAAERGYSEYDEEHLQVAPVSSAEYPTKAKRPTNSRMNKAKLSQNGFEHLPTWQDALARYLSIGGILDGTD